MMPNEEIKDEPESAQPEPVEKKDILEETTEPITVKVEKPKTDTDEMDLDAVVGESIPTTEIQTEEIAPELTNSYRIPSSGSQKPLHHHSMKRIIIAAVVILILAIVAAGAIWATHDNPVDNDQSEIIYSQGAAITAVEGTVEYDTGSGWVAVEQGVNLNESDSLRTLENSRAIITLDDGSAIRLDSNSTVTMTKLTVDEVTVDNDGGQVYTRIAPSETRKFYVYIDDQPFMALGTAYRTTNITDEQGVEVYQSTVKTMDAQEQEINVAEGEAFFVKSKIAEQVDKISKLDIEKLKDDDFLKWNKSLDENEKEFADKLGFLVDIDQPKKEENNENSSSASNGISASGVKVDSGIKISWSATGIDTSDGFKIVYSDDNDTPSYGENSAKYVDSGTFSQVLELTDGRIWHVRVCAYRSEGLCENYSNVISITAPYKEKAPVQTGPVTAILNGNQLSWTYGGTAPYGFRVVWNTSGKPTYPVSGDKSGYEYLSSSNDVKFDLSERITDPGTYFIRVCKYTSGSQTEQCIDYSEQTIKYIVN